jgi:hypothetical protein
LNHVALLALEVQQGVEGKCSKIMKRINFDEIRHLPLVASICTAAYSVSW